MRANFLNHLIFSIARFKQICSRLHKGSAGYPGEAAGHPKLEYGYFRPLKKKARR
jgi:hypothetical protein